MPEIHNGIVSVLFHSAIAEWITTLGLIFGGCCSNAWALELATSQYPHAGSLITFSQFLLVSMYGLRKHIIVAQKPTQRNELLRIVAAKILDLYSQKNAAEQIYVAVEGAVSHSHAFADELAHELELSSPAVVLKRFTFAGDVKDVLSHLDTLWSMDAPADSVVLADGEILHAREFRGRWNFCVLLVSSKGGLGLDSHKSEPPLTNPSLTVDMSSSTYPVVISPLPTRLNPQTLLSTLTRLRLKKRSIPISRWAIQVALFLITSLLNNAAFGYNVPMAVHIIFRSGGLVVNMLMGWLVDRRRYNRLQIISVLLVTIGVVCTTLSASQRPPRGVFGSSLAPPGSYFIGILILTLALVMSGFMGLAQDKAYAKYGRGHWQEAMFYLHFLALPGFTFFWRDLITQVQTVNASPRVAFGIEILASPLGMRGSFPVGGWFDFHILRRLIVQRVSVPSFYFPLLLNVVTQLLCVSGVHRLTSRVNSLTVTLVLVVRKAVSLGISVVVLRKGGRGGMLLWLGAGLVLAGTIGYSIGGIPKRDRRGDAKKER